MATVEAMDRNELPKGCCFQNKDKDYMSVKCYFGNERKIMLISRAFSDQIDPRDPPGLIQAQHSSHVKPDLNWGRIQLVHWRRNDAGSTNVSAT